MKGTDHFKRTIYMYLEQRAEEDALFAKKYRNPAKNMDECVTHILNYVQKSGCNGFTDGEIFGQAIHYYEENEIEVGKPIQLPSGYERREPRCETHGRGKGGATAQNITRHGQHSGYATPLKAAPAPNAMPNSKSAGHTQTHLQGNAEFQRDNHLQRVSSPATQGKKSRPMRSPPRAGPARCTPPAAKLTRRSLAAFSSVLAL